MEGKLKQSVKRRLALYLALLMMLPTLFALCPMRAEAAYLDGVSGYVKIEAGQKFYAGDLIQYWGNNGYYYTLSQLNGATYKSSKTAVATVNKSTGLVNAKTVGTTKIKVSYKSKKVVIELQVVEKGSLGTTTTYKKLNALAKKINKAITSDPATAIELAFQFNEQLEAYSDVFWVMTGNWWQDMRYGAEGDYTGSVYMLSLYVPLSARIETVCAMYNPLATRSAKAFRVARDSANYFTASVSKNTLTMNLKSKVTEEQVIWLRNEYAQTSTKNTFFTVDIWDETDEKSYTGRVYVTAGSKKLTIRLYNEKGKRQSVQEGHIYYFAGPGFMSGSSSAAV